MTEEYQNPLWDTSESLYHGSVLEYDLDVITYFWTSYNYKQSGLHIFDSKCARYKNNTERYNSTNLWPFIDEYKAIKPLKLLKLKFNDNDKYQIYDDIQNDTHKYIDIDIFILKYNINIELINREFISINNNKYNNCQNDFSKECNKKILIMIERINENFSKNYDGYICEDDENEIAIINPSRKIQKITQYKLISLSSSIIPETYYVYTDQCILANTYNKFINEYYNIIINIINKKFDVNIMPDLNFVNDINEDLLKIRKNIKDKLRKALRNKIHNNKITDEDENEINKFTDYNRIINDNPTCFKKINITTDMLFLSDHEKNIIFRYFICPNINVIYTDNKNHKLMERNNFDNLIFVNDQLQNLLVD